MPTALKNNDLSPEEREAKKKKYLKALAIGAGLTGAAALGGLSYMGHRATGSLNPYGGVQYLQGRMKLKPENKGFDLKQLESLKDAMDDPMTTAQRKDILKAFATNPNGLIHGLKALAQQQQQQKVAFLSGLGGRINQAVKNGMGSLKSLGQKKNNAATVAQSTTPPPANNSLFTQSSAGTGAAHIQPQTPQIVSSTHQPTQPTAAGTVTVNYDVAPTAKASLSDRMRNLYEKKLAWPVRFMTMGALGASAWRAATAEPPPPSPYGDDNNGYN